MVRRAGRANPRDVSAILVTLSGLPYLPTGVVFGGIGLKLAVADEHMLVRILGALLVLSCLPFVGVGLAATIGRSLRIILAPDGEERSAGGADRTVDRSGSPW